MTHHYTDTYKEHAFYIWYENDTPGIQKLLHLLPEEEGNKPARVIVEGWRDSLGWIERADGLDAEVSQAIDDKVIDRRVKMWEEHAETGEELIKLGRKYLQDHELQDSQAAIRAISTGAELQKDSVGKAEAWMKYSRMTDLQITKELERLSGKQVKDEFIIDAESDDVSDTESTEE